MNRWLVAVAAVACLAGAVACGDDDDGNPTGPSQGSNTLVFRADMTSAQEVPAITNAEAGASGTATMTFNVTRDSANAITGGTVTFQFSVSGLTTTSSITLAHIHTGASGVAGGVLVNTGLSAAAAIATPNGSGSFQSSAPVAVDASTINSIVANPAGFYFNVHTSLNPSGVVRGQLRAQ
jgi:hypothetical protein